MKILILAAGAGVRLGQKLQPKPLTLLSNGKSILQFQLETFKSFTSIDDIYIIVGYKKEIIMDLFPDLAFIYNPNYRQENTARSILRAVKKIDDDLLWVNGDVVFHPKVIRAIFDKQKTCMIVNRSEVGLEEVKYRTDGSNHILEVSKEVLNPEGEALGINFFLRNDLALLKENLKKCQDRDYFEKAIELCLEDGMSIESILVEKESCMEIDFPKDLEKANQLIQAWFTL